MTHEALEQAKPLTVETLDNMSHYEWPTLIQEVYATVRERDALSARIAELGLKARNAGQRQREAEVGREAMKAEVRALKARIEELEAELAEVRAGRVKELEAALGMGLCSAHRTPEVACVMCNRLQAMHDTLVSRLTHDTAQWLACIAERDDARADLATAARVTQEQTARIAELGAEVDVLMDRIGGLT